MSKRICILLSVIMIMTTVFTAPAFATSAKATDKLAVNDVDVKLYSSNTARVTWDKNKNVDGYTIYKKTDGKYKPIKYLKDDKYTSYKVKKLKKGKTYEFAVRAYEDSTGKKKFSKSYKKDRVAIPKKLSTKSSGYKYTTAARLMKVAKSKIGKQYVSGASGPNSFDCSGYVYYCLKKSKASTKKVSRTSSASMYSKLKKYRIGSDLSKAQVGDIVFTSYGKRVSHVGFYYGNGKLIHATNPRTDVTISPAKYYGHVVGIVRLPNL